MTQEQNYVLGLSAIDDSVRVSKAVGNLKERVEAYNDGKLKTKPQHDQILRPLTNCLKDLGFDGFKRGQRLTYEPVRVQAKDGKGTKNEFYSDNTILMVLSRYKTIAMAVDITGNRAEITIRKVKNWFNKENIKSEYLDSLDHTKPLSELRIIEKQLRREFKRDSSVLSVLRWLELENIACTYIQPCIQFLKNRVSQDASTNEEKKTEFIDVINPEFLVAWATKILESQTSGVTELASALIAATGRRPTEVLKTANFAAIEGESNWVMFGGQLKLKDRATLGSSSGLELPEGESPDWYSIPVLVDSSLIISGITRLRRLQKKESKTTGSFKFLNQYGKEVESWACDNKFDKNDTLHNAAVHNHYEAVFRGFIKREYSHSSMTLYMFRSAYTEISFNKGITRVVNQKRHRALVLGHGDLESQSNYDKFMLSTDPKFASYMDKGYKCERFTRVFENAVKLEVSEESKGFADELSKFDGEIFGNTRAKSLHRIHAHIKKLALTTGLTKETVTSSWLRAQIIDGKAIGKRSVDQYMTIISGE